MKTDEKITLYPAKSDWTIDNGQIETHYTHIYQNETFHYRLVTNWTCAYNRPISMITATLLKLTDNDWLNADRTVLFSEEVELTGQQARKAAVQKHAALVTAHLNM